MSVAVFHTITSVDYTQVGRIYFQMFWQIDGTYDRLTKVVFTLFNGLTPVVIFFILSGAVLSKSLMRADGPLRTTAKDFLIRRVLRIYPALLVCLIPAWMIFNAWVYPIPLSDLGRNVILYDFTPNGSTWTLNVEMLAGPLILLAFVGFAYFREVGLIIALIAISLAFHHIIPPGPPEFLRTYWSCFAVGMLVPTHVGELVARYLPRHSWIVALIVMMIANYVIPYPGYATVVHRVSAALLVSLLYYGQAGSLGRFLDRPISVFMGRISYSFYLFAAPMMFLLGGILKWIDPWVKDYPLEAGVPLAALVVAATIPVAMLSYRWVEKPFIILSGRLTGSGRGSRVSPSAEAVSSVPVS